MFHYSSIFIWNSMRKKRPTQDGAGEWRTGRPEAHRFPMWAVDDVEVGNGTFSNDSVRKPTWMRCCFRSRYRDGLNRFERVHVATLHH